MYAGDCMITRRGDLIDCIAPSEGFKVDVIYVTPEFIELSTPQSNYGMRGQLALFMLITAIMRNFYERLLRIDTLKRFGIEARTRMKAFINRLIAVPAKWVRTGRQNVLNLYTGNAAYVDLFAEYG